MSSESEPNWDLLPQYPEAFFNLTGPFDRKDLKRAYNALIRRYKPEKHPAEFQKIRAAYDELDRRLRYGTEESVPVRIVAGEGSDLSPEQIRQLEAAFAKIARRRETSTNERKQLLADLESISPDELYRQLKDRSSRTPTEYLFLAFLSDLFEERAQSFLRWLFAGLKEHPESGELLAMLQESLRSTPDEQLIAVLKAVAAAVGNDRFYYLTEATWQKLLDVVPFEQFADTLRECESRLTDYRNRGKLVFYVQILRKAMWFADSAWIKEIMSVITENQMELVDHLGYELEMNDVLLDYIRVRGKFLNGHPLREAIDRTIYRYCVMDDLPALQEYLAAQQRLGKAADNLLEAFPIGQMPYNPVYAPWCWLAQETEQRIGHERRELKPRELAPKVGRLLQEIDSQTGTGRVGFLWKTYDVVMYAAFFMLVIGIPGLLWYAIASIAGSDGAQVVGAFVAVGAAVANYHFTVPRVVEWLRSHWCQRLALRSYLTVWRREIFNFLQLSYVPVEDVLRLIEAFEQDEETANRFQYIHWISLFLQQDFGLAFYSLSQQFQK